MSEEKVVIILDQTQLLELEEIMLEKDKDAALKFLEVHIYKEIEKRKLKQMKPDF